MLRGINKIAVPDLEPLDDEQDDYDENVKNNKIEMANFDDINDK